MKIYLLHGWAQDPKNEVKWDQFRSALQRAGYETVFLAIPGLTTPLSEAWQLSNYVEWLRTKLPKREKVVLLGHSFGGQIACRFSSQNPDRVKHLILIDSAGIRNRSWQAITKRFVFGVLASFGKKITRSSSLRHMLYRMARENDYLQASPALRETMAAVLADEVLKDLPRIVAPTCVIWGEHDTATPVFMAYQFVSMIPNAQLHIVSGARHSPHFTHPTIVTTYIQAFLQVEQRIR